MKKPDLASMGFLQKCSSPWTKCLEIALFAALLTAGLFCPMEGYGADENPLSVDAIFANVQKRYGGLDFEADFVQESHMEAMGIVDTAKGHVYFKPPFMMRWHYKEPESYMIVTDGQTVWIHRPLDHQVMIGKAADYFGGTHFTDFFSNPEKLRENFFIETVSRGNSSANCHLLRLVPGKGAANVQEVYLYVSKETYDIVQTDTVNAFGDRTRLRFSGFKVNQGLDESLFRFKVPDNTDVMQLDRPF